VKTLTIRVRQRNHDTDQVFVAASADIARDDWDRLIQSGQFAVSPEKAALLSPRYSAWMQGE